MKLPITPPIWKTPTRPAYCGPIDIAAAVPVYAGILDTVETSFPGATERERFQESVRHLIDGLVSGLIEGTVSCARASGAKDPEAVRHLPSRVVRYTEEAAATSRDVKRFLNQHVYSSAELAADRSRSMERLARLFHYLMANPDLLPGNDINPTESKSLQTSRWRQHAQA